MFGNNRPLKKEGDGKTLWVQSVFPTLQGEGPFSGLPAIFVRLAGCNLQCTFCDTDFESSDWKPSLQELLGSILTVANNINTKLVVLTGGEPLRQNIVPLVTELIKLKFRVQIETAGTLWQKELTPLVYRGALSVVCSPKTAVLDSEIHAVCHDYKYIIRAGQVDPADGLPNRGTQPKQQGPVKIARPLSWQHSTVWLQPCEEYDHGEPDRDATNLNVQVAVGLCMKHGYRLCLQTHKLVGLP